MLRAPHKLGLIAAVLVVSSGCNTPGAVSTFCGSANATLASAIPVFQDLSASCLREVNIQKGIGTFVAVQADSNCALIGEQAEGAVAAVSILSDYFNALNSIATFGTAKVSSDASTLISKTVAAVGAKSPAQTALGSMANFLTSTATGAYQAKSLNKDLDAVSNNIGNVTDALVTILQNNYLGTGQGLTQESEKLSDRYKEFAHSYNTANNADILLTLDDRWHADEQALQVRRASAQNLISALQAIKKGVAALSKNGRSVTSKELPGLLSPYITQLQTLIPEIQKGF